MKKILVGIATVVALSSTAAMADTPAVKELNDYNHILAVGNQNRGGASEFVIYHQDGRRPCGPKGKMHHGKKGEKKEGEHKHHHHHHHDGKKDAAKPAAAPAGQ